MTDLELHVDYQGDPLRREAFHRFAEETFDGVSFRGWDAAGGWTEAYHAASCFDGPAVAANASVSQLEIVVRGERRSAVQFATVGTRPAYRSRGLSSRLMRSWLDRLAWDDTLCFLFGNETVLDFYPRFGFRRVEEHTFVSSVRWPANAQTPRRLNPRHAPDGELLLRVAGRRTPVTQLFGCVDYGFILLFYLHLGYPAPFHHHDDAGAIVVASWKDGRMDVYDIIAPDMSAAVPLLEKTADEPIREVAFHFTPDRIDLPSRPLPRAGDSPLLVRGALPLEGEPFKFPFLAQT